MRIRSVHIVAAVLISTSTPTWSLEGSGLAPTESGWFAGTWQARVELGAGSAPPHHANPYNITAQAPASPRSSFSVLGDYYFSTQATAGKPPTAFSGFRATSGLMLSSRNSSSAGGTGFSYDTISETGPVPYFGVGYTDLPSRAGWGFSADFGLMALSSKSAVRLGGVLGGAQSVDDLLRDLRLSPLIQLGVSYSF